MDRRLVLLPLLALAGPSLSGCVAAAIPAIAGSALVGKRVIDGDKNSETADAPVGPAVAAVAVPVAPPPAPTPKVTTPPPISSAATQARVASSPSILPPAARLSTPPGPAFDVSNGPQIIAAAPVLPSANLPRVAPVVSPRAPASYPDPSNPLPDEQLGFARFVRYGQASALGAQSGADLTSAMLSDPIAIDGKRRRCSAGEQQVVVIDLDPKDGVFVPPANPAEQPGLALGLAVLREAGVEIAWLSEMTTDKSGALRTALERSGLDPRGEDIISLGRDGTDSKQKRKDNLAGITCIVAIAGDERADFDERFKYLRSPEAGAELEPLIGDGWFLIAPLLGTQGQ